MKYSRAAFILFILGIVLIGASAVFGKGKIGLLLFIPVFYGTGILAFFGILCIVVSMFLMFYSMTSILGDEEEHVAPVKQERKVKAGGIIFIGPVPIVFGSDTKIVYIMLILALIVTGMMILLWILIH
jgi:uncharacterized protein (TIGR00304 family)